MTLIASRTWLLSKGEGVMGETLCVVGHWHSLSAAFSFELPFGLHTALQSGHDQLVSHNAQYPTSATSPCKIRIVVVYFCTSVPLKPGGLARAALPFAVHSGLLFAFCCMPPETGTSKNAVDRFLRVPHLSLPSLPCSVPRLPLPSTSRGP